MRLIPFEFRVGDSLEVLNFEVECTSCNTTVGSQCSPTLTHVDAPFFD